MKTINRAFALAGNGGTIVVRGGVYRDGLSTGAGYKVDNRSITLQAYPHQKAWYPPTLIATSSGGAAARGLFINCGVRPAELLAGFFEREEPFDGRLLRIPSLLPSGDFGEVRVLIPEALAILGSPQLLEQILTQLLVNAGHAIVDGPGQWRIEVIADARGTDVEVEVRDNGRGMDAQTQARIFSPFFSTRSVGKGSGLGLSVTAGLVSTLGGTLTVMSQPGAGTSLRLRLPGGPSHPSG